VKRILLADIAVATDGARTPTLPAGATGFVCLHDFPARGKMLVKVNLPDGTAVTAATIADITMEATEDGRQRQVDVNPAALTTAQRDAWRTRLQAAGFDVSDFDTTITDRAKLLWHILRRIASRNDMTVSELLFGYDAG
jgi:hypothetical protein